MKQNIVSNFFNIWCRYVVEHNHAERIWFIECRFRADLTGHGHHIGHEGRISEKETACRARPRFLVTICLPHSDQTFQIPLISAFNGRP